MRSTYCDVRLPPSERIIVELLIEFVILSDSGSALRIAWPA
ncbi:hypothetical protein I543_1093 [Mycobacteroides abscessus 21]|uniref:Uncharacterized protein n=1 Tax=Mycobacteroides abscessus 21 TaxID=1299324 RepID=A0A829Q877_9MYCO|nr:hypothetical protein I543_1093 [Mycobacteroides abscessus 21]